MSIHELGKRARAASRALAHIAGTRRDAVLYQLADALRDNEAAILAANAIDVANAQAKGVEAYFVDRLTLTPQRLAAIAGDVLNVAALPDPIGEPFDLQTLPNGLRLHKRRIPLGVIGVIYESRPNVTIDIAALCIKSGNATILRGGSDNINSNQALLAVIQAALNSQGLPLDSVLLVEDLDRARILDLLKLNDCIDLIIPRGGANLHKLCSDNSTIPVITGGMGINHIFVEASADQDMALDILYNAKISKPTVCNALGTALIQREIATGFLPRMAARLAEKSVSLRCDPEALAILRQAGAANLQAASPEDWDTEWLDLILGVKVVDGLDEALAFISAHSMEHSDGIVSRDPETIAAFLNAVNSSGVFVNCSTRFNDGGQFGLGAEVAVSTQRIHARGPMGLRELTSYKWICEGDGQVRW
jgi:glutamate-5-semialdehyde dehydrogenase